jgi:hypothetical protein
MLCPSRSFSLHLVLYRYSVNFIIPIYSPFSSSLFFKNQMCVALGVESVSFGYEKSADYGNGICVNDVEVSDFFKLFFHFF